MKGRPDVEPHLSSHAPETSMPNDRDLRFAALAIDGNLIRLEQVAELAGSDRDRDRDRTLDWAEAAEGRGWIGRADREAIEARIAVPEADRALQTLRDRIAGASDPRLHALLPKPDEHSPLDPILETVVGRTIDPSDSNGRPSPIDPALETAAETRLGQTVPDGGPATLPASHMETRDSGSHDEFATTDGGEPALVGQFHATADAERAGRYTMTKLHAKGGVGQVWIARDRALGREVALKRIRDDRDSHGQVAARFVAEARITGRLEHPGIVPVYELTPGDRHESPYYTMRLVRGQTFREAVAAYHLSRSRGEDDPLQFRALLEAFVAACNAVAYAHSRGVIHRDLKGQNIMLGDFGEAIVLDWGLAKVVGSRDEAAVGGRSTAHDPGINDLALAETLDGQVLGTPAYMPPEQAEGRIEAVDESSDVYSLGAILYELLCDRAPFVESGVSTVELLRRVREDDPVPPRSIQPRAPRALEAVCLKAMAKAPADRYGSVGALAADVRRWLADEPLLAYRDPWTVRLGRWSRRHRTLATTAAALVVASTVALAVGGVLVARERDRARAQARIARTAVDEMYTEVAETWLEDASDPLQERFLQRALARYEGPLAEAEAADPDGIALAVTDGNDRLDPSRRALLGRAADYYERFADLAEGDTPLRFEAARARRRLGDVRRKLGDFDAAEASYHAAIDALDDLAGPAPGDPEVRSERSKARARLGALLAARADSKAASELLADALAEQEALAESGPESPADALDRARTRRELAEVAKLDGRHDEAEAAYKKAVADLERLVEADPTAVEPRRELADAADAYGVLLLLLGRESEAEANLRRAEGLLGPLLAELPTVPAVRDSLAKTSNSLGLLLREAGTPGEAADALRESLGQYERLAEDFPGRVDYRRALGRSLVNLGIIAQEAGRLGEAQGLYERAEPLYRGLVDEAPGLAKARRDLGRTASNLGTVLEKLGRPDDAEAAYRRAVEVDEALVREWPDVPDYRMSLADTLLNLGRVRRSLGDLDESGLVYARALELYGDLADDHPDRPDYREGLARGTALDAALLARLGDPEAAERAYRESIAAFEALLDADPDDRAVRASMASAINNLADLKPDDAEALDLRALALYEALAVDDPAERLHVATVENNLGELLEAQGRRPEALERYGRSVAAFEATELDPKADHARHHLLAYVLANLAKARLQEGDPADAADQLASAVDHEREALKAGPRPAYQSALGEHLAGLARAELAVGRYVEAAETAVALVEAAPGLAESRREAAAILAGCASRAESDESRDPSDRDRLARSYGGRAVAQLRVGLDAGLEPDGLLSPDPDLDPIRDRPDFQALLEDARAIRDAAGVAG